MKDFDNSYLTQIELDEATTFMMVEMDVSDSLTLRHTTLDINVIHDSNKFLSEEFSISGINQSAGTSVDRVKLTYRNIDLSFSSILLNNSVKGRTVVIYEGALDGYTPIVEKVYEGIILTWDIDAKNAVITLSNEMMFWKKKTLRYPSVTCRWDFKGIECGYTGSETLCGKAYENCQAYGNTDNFGGFRFLKSLEERKIYWGRQPS